MNVEYVDGPQDGLETEIPDGNPISYANVLNPIYRGSWRYEFNLEDGKLHWMLIPPHEHQT